MRVSWRRRLPLLAGLAALAALMGVRVLLPDPFVRATSFASDTLQRAIPWSTRAPQVSIVDIDDASLKRLGQWPWSRSVLAKLVAALQGLGAKAIVFDVVFAEADRSSPSLLAEEWERSFGWKLAAGERSSLPDYDRAFAEQIGRGRVVTGYGLLAEANGLAPRVAAGVATIGESPVATLRDFKGAIPNQARIEDAAAGNGSFSITTGRDEVVRRIPLLLSFNGKIVPSLALEALRVAEGERTIKVRSEGSADAVAGYTVRVGDYDVPVEPDGSFLMHYGGKGRPPSVPAWTLIGAETGPENRNLPGQRDVPDLRDAIDGRIVLIGTSAVGLVDLRTTPVDPMFPGVAIHAQALEQILAHHFLGRPAWMGGAEAVVAVIATIAMVLLATLADLSLALAVCAVTVGLVLAVCVAAFARFDLLLDPSLILLVCVPSTLIATFARYLVAERDAMKMRAAFTHYLAPTLVEALARQPDRLKLGGELREMTFVFTDLEGFTALTEASKPTEIVAWLNEYLDGICGIAMDHGGTIDKIVGDAVHVMFNAPLDQPDHAERGVRCAMDIDAFARRLQAGKQAEGVRFGSTRIGVNTGPAVVGNFGGSRRFDYTAHGDAINTAARLETANKRLGTSICISRSTVEKVASIEFLQVATLSLKGKADEVDAFVPATVAEPWLALHRDAFTRMIGGDTNGADCILRLALEHPEHRVLALQAERIQSGAHLMRIAA